MRIAPINHTQQNQPKFQALKIDAKLATVLETKTPEYINKLERIGHELGTITRFNVVLNEKDLVPKIFATNVTRDGAKDYFKELKQEIEPNLGRAYYLTVAGETVSGFNPKVPGVYSDVYENEATQLEKYNAFCKLDELEQAATYSRLLETRAINREIKEQEIKKAEEARKAAEEQKRAEQRKAVSELLEKYGVKEETKQAAPQPKKRWWQI